MNGKRSELVIVEAPRAAPYVFVNEKRAKPSHVQVVRLMQREALCHNGCGNYWIPAEPTPAELGEVACPDCHEPPKPWRVGPPEEIEVAVHTAFGDLVDLAFLRAVGKISRRVIGSVLGSAVSRGVVTSPRGMRG